MVSDQVERWRRDEIVAYLRERANPAADLSRVISILCALREGEELDEPDSRRPPARPVAILTPHELAQLIAAPPKPRSSLLFRTLYSGASRAQETIGLRVADINGHNFSAFIRGGKGDIDRYLMLDPATVAALLQWQQGHPPETRLFDFAYATNVYPLFERWCTRLGIWQKYEALGLRLSPHCIRHSCATHCYERGMPVWSIKAMLGHSVLSMTDLYVHGGLHTHRERYMASVPRPEHDTRVGPEGFWEGRAESREPKLSEVLRFILDAVPASADLHAVIAALCQRRMELLGSAAREFVEEMGNEVALEALFRGDRLPLVVSRHEVLALVTAPDDELDALLFQVLYATGMRVEEALGLAFRDLDAGEQTLRLADRVVLADPGTFARLEVWQGDREPGSRIFRVSLGEAEARLQKWAGRVGVADRYRGTERQLSLRLFRHAFGSHRYEDGMDIFTLKALLGHEHVGTTAMYATTAIGRNRSDYLRSHPLANGEIELP